MSELFKSSNDIEENKTELSIAQLTRALRYNYVDISDSVIQSEDKSVVPIKNDILFENVSFNGSFHFNIDKGVKASFVDCDFNDNCSIHGFDNHGVLISIVGCNFKMLELSGIENSTIDYTSGDKMYFVGTRIKFGAGTVLSSTRAYNKNEWSFLRLKCAIVGELVGGRNLGNLTPLLSLRNTFCGQLEIDSFEAHVSLDYTQVRRLNVSGVITEFSLYKVSFIGSSNSLNFIDVKWDSSKVESCDFEGGQFSYKGPILDIYSTLSKWPKDVGIRWGMNEEKIIAARESLTALSKWVDGNDGRSLRLIQGDLKRLEFKLMNNKVVQNLNSKGGVKDYLGLAFEFVTTNFGRSIILPLIWVFVLIPGVFSFLLNYLYDGGDCLGVGSQWVSLISPLHKLVDIYPSKNCITGGMIFLDIILRALSAGCIYQFLKVFRKPTS